MKSIRQIAFACLALWLFAGSNNPAFSKGFEDCPQFFMDGLRPATKIPSYYHPQELCFANFAVMYSGLTKTPLYVAERLSAETIQQAKQFKRTDRFYEEARLPSAYRATLEDYRHINTLAKAENKRYDRGHMAPAADMYTQEGMEQSFSLANMVPQASELNEHDWSIIERSVRAFAKRARGYVYVITGPIFAKHTVATSGPTIPDATFKVVLDASSGKSFGWIMSNDASRHSLRPIAYIDVTNATGINFFPILSQQVFKQ